MRALTIRKETRWEDTRPRRIPCLVEPLQLPQALQRPQSQHPPQLPALPAQRSRPEPRFYQAPLRPKYKGFLNSHSPHRRCYYCKNRTPRGYSARSAEAAICGSRWNYYLAYAKTIPQTSLPEHLAAPVTACVLNGSNSHNGAETPGGYDACGTGRQVYFSFGSYAAGHHSHAAVATPAGQDYGASFQPIGTAGWTAMLCVPAGNAAVQAVGWSAAPSHAATNGGVARSQATQHESETTDAGNAPVQAMVPAQAVFSLNISIRYVQDGIRDGSSQMSWGGSTFTPQAATERVLASPVPTQTAHAQAAATSGGVSRSQATQHETETTDAGNAPAQAMVPAQAVFSLSSISSIASSGSTHLHHGSLHHGSWHHGSGHVAAGTHASIQTQPGAGCGINAAAIVTLAAVSGPVPLSQPQVMDVTLAISYNPLSQMSYVPTWQVGIMPAKFAYAHLKIAAGLVATTMTAEHMGGMAVEAAVAGTMPGGTGLQVGQASSPKRGYTPKVARAADAVPE